MRRREKKTIVYHPCSVCLGSGSVKVIREVPFMDASYWESCKECGGTGWGPVKEIRVETDITGVQPEEMGYDG